jgi:gluconate 2-dehydrogenase gamma chain
VKLSDLNADILLEVLKFLWPDDGEGPSVEKAGIFQFFLWLFSDPDFDPEEKEYLKKGLIWIDETAVEEHSLNFDKLGADTKKSLLEKTANLDWGESWYSKITNIIFEALFADPFYGSNTAGASYKWLNHNPGSPRPDERNNYKALLEKKKEIIEVTQLDQLK